VGSADWVSEGAGGIHIKDGVYIVLPNTAVLDSIQENDYSVSAWFKPDSDPAEENDHIHSGYSIMIKGGNHAGLVYYHGGYFTMDHWFVDNQRADAVANGQFAPNTLYHLVGVVNRTDGETRVYVNGKLLGKQAWSAGAGAASRPYGSMPWKIGVALLDNAEWAWPAKGIVRDVRLYKGALSDSDVEGIFAGK
jgi:hypothetical protein